MQAKQSIPSNAFRPANMPQAATRTPQPASRRVVVPLRSQPTELDRVVELGYN
ncbi:hypothetical protein O4G98_07390 [Zoogloeaceae bacterium G21618-S1]|jgi:hypothetical protein|nr:hypothetical protein [Zoogloeaceae bacterium G21618-S1]